VNANSFTKQNIRLSSIEELSFDKNDLSLFQLSDMKTKLTTVQNYFFPRFDYLVKRTANAIYNVYEINPYDMMSQVKHPQNRVNANKINNFHTVIGGFSGKRNRNRFLQVFREDGSPYKFHISRLVYILDSQTEEFYVKLYFYYWYGIGLEFKQNVYNFFSKYKNEISGLMNYFNLYYYDETNPYNSFDQFIDNLLNEEIWDPSLHSFKIILPISNNNYLPYIIATYISLYPLLDSLILIEKGKKPRFKTLLSKMYHYLDNNDNFETEDNYDNDNLNETKVEQTLNNLDNYDLIRPSIWFNVLKRDNWKCQSCGRSGKDGITLEVDHILPRSKGGTDDIDNLQTLCKKCNIGKSNRDDTDLRK
jgi:hypothetical protein